MNRKRRILPLCLAAALLALCCAALSGCGEDKAVVAPTLVPRATLDPSESQAGIRTESIGGGSDSAHAYKVRSSGTLSNSVSYVLYENGALTLSGQSVTNRLKDEPMLKAQVDDVTSVTFGEGVAVVGSGVCADMRNVTELHFGADTREIQSEAFKNCTALNLIEWGGVEHIANYAFSGCSALSSLTLDDRLTTIDSYAFDSCGGLKMVTVGSGVSSMGMNVFKGCVDLTMLTIRANVGNSAFADCTALQEVIIEAPARDVGDSAFSGCTSLKTVSLPDGLFSIGDSAFSGCANMKAVNLPEGLDSIGMRAFQGCENLEQLTLPGSMRVIGESAFENCRLIQTLAVPAAVEEIGAQAFKGCAKLQSITFAGSAHDLRLGSYAFAECVTLKDLDLTRAVTQVGDHAFRGCTALEEVSVGGRIRDMGKRIFAECTGLRKLTVSINIPEETFAEMTGLTDVIFGKGVVRIGRRAFEGCTALSQVDFRRADIATKEVTKDGVEVIGDEAFKGCTKLTRVRFPASLRELGIGIFEDCFTYTYASNVSLRLHYEGTKKEWDKVSGAGRNSSWAKNGQTYLYPVCDSKTEWNTNSSGDAVLRKGSKGGEVTRLQEKLIDMGLLNGSADGNFGDKTREAVIKAQKQLGFEQTGEATQEFLDALYAQ